jgi:fermentation-respiration switch protein FrsA (DUF1100 family)
MAALKTILLTVLVGYVVLVALMYAAQRRLMYFPDRARTPPALAGLPAAEEIALDTEDGERVIAWSIPARADKPVVLYFHGNGGALAYRAARFRALVADSTGLLALSYRGYGGSTGTPSEAGLIADARALYRYAAARTPVERIVLWGESLGSGVAVALAAQEKVGRLILEAPFTSAEDVAARVYSYLPVRLLMKDRFRSDARIGEVSAPVLVLHGDRDGVVPIALGERLFALVRSPKRLVRFPGGGHEDLDAHGAMAAVKRFLQEPAAAIN